MTAFSQIGSQAKAWVELTRVFNIPVPLCGILAGAHSLSAGFSRLHGVVLVVAALSTAAVQAFNDYEDRNTDETNASFRPIPSGRLSARSVLIGGYTLTVLAALLSTLFSPWSAVAILGWSALTRYYSRLKRYSLAHHLLMPAALGLTPIYGSLLFHGEVSGPALYAALAIFFIDLNMNIVGTFKDLWDGSTQERVLPVVIGSRPSILVALCSGILGIVLVTVPVFNGDLTWYPLVPLAAGLILHLHSRIRLYRKPCAERGYTALKSGRLTECFTFPALMTGTLPLWEGYAIVAAMVLLAIIAQRAIPEALLPEEASQVLSI